VIEYIGDWERYLALDVGEEQLARFRKNSRTGRPLGSDTFIHHLEDQLDRFVGKRKPGPKGPR
jgi:putative transposase